MQMISFRPRYGPRKFLYNLRYAGPSDTDAARLRTDVTGCDTAHHDAAAGAAFVAAALMLAMPDFSPHAWARGRVSQDDVASCANSPKAEAAVAACTRLFEDGGLDARNKAIALGNRGAAYKLMGRHDAAIADFDIAIGLDPKNPQYWCQRGDARAKKQQFAEASRLHGRARQGGELRLGIPRARAGLPQPGQREARACRPQRGAARQAR